jgi:hypothetical protein
VLWVASFVALAGLIVLSLIPSPPGLAAFPGADKVWHVLSYAGVAGLWLLAGVWRPGRGPGRYPEAMLKVVIGFAMLGAVIEVVQHWFDRAADPLDWLADVAGVAIALAGWNALRRRDA